MLYEGNKFAICLIAAFGLLSILLYKKMLTILQFHLASLLIIIFLILLWRRLFLAEQATLKNQLLFKTVIQNAVFGIAFMDLEGTILDANSALEKILGYASDDLRKQNLFKLIHCLENPDSLEFLPDLINEKIDNYQIEKPFLKNNGQLVWVQLIVTLIRNNTGTPQFLLGMLHDVSNRKQIETDLAAEKESLAVTLRSIADGVIATDLKGRIVLINEAAEEITEWSGEQMLGRQLTEVYSVANEDTDNVKNEFIEHTTLITRDGKKKIIAENGASIRDQNGNVSGMVIVFRDITEKCRMEEEMSRAQKLESIGKLAGGIAHDFNNLLAVFSANIQLIRLYLEKGKAISRSLDMMEDVLDRAVALTKQLLTFSRGGAPIKRITSISKLIKEAVELGLQGTNIKCNFQMQEDLWPAEVDQGQISQVLNNFIANASEGKPDGGLIEITAVNRVIGSGDVLPLTKGNYIQISIKNRSFKFPEQNLNKIFDPDFTISDGLGLRMATSYSIIKKHNGFIDVYSMPSEGTTFIIYLAATNKRLVPSVQNSPLNIERQLKILLMDDEQTIRQSISQLLTQFGFKVETVSDGLEAVDFFKKAKISGEPYDIIIMDLIVPGGMGGREVIAELLKIDPSVKAIVSSGYSNDPVMADFISYGFKGVVVKPFKIEEMIQTVAEVMKA